MKIEQRIGRIDRIGQQSDKISIYNFLVSGSIDENILDTISRKMNIIEGSFAEIMPIIEKTWEGASMVDEEIINLELKKATELQKSLDLLFAFRGLDLDITGTISDENCDIEQWYQHNWLEGLPWQNDCRDWTSKVRSNSLKLNQNLNAYNHI